MLLTVGKISYYALFAPLYTPLTYELTACWLTFFITFLVSSRDNGRIITSFLFGHIHLKNFEISTWFLPRTVSQDCTPKNFRCTCMVLNRWCLGTVQTTPSIHPKKRNDRINYIYILQIYHANFLHPRRLASRPQKLKRIYAQSSTQVASISDSGDGACYFESGLRCEANSK